MVHLFVHDLPAHFLQLLPLLFILSRDDINVMTVHLHCHIISVSIHVVYWDEGLSLGVCTLLGSLNIILLYIIFRMIYISNYK